MSGSTSGSEDDPSEGSEEEDIDAELERLYGRVDNRAQPVQPAQSSGLAGMRGVVEVEGKAVKARRLGQGHHLAKQKAIPIFFANRLMRNKNPDLFQIDNEVLVCHLDLIGDDDHAKGALTDFIKVIYRIGDDYYGFVAEY